MNQVPVGPKDLWGEHPIPGAGETRRIDVGPLAVWLRSVENELWLAHAGRGENDGPLPEPPADIEWRRWALPEGAHRIRIRPVLPDRPLVVKPEHSFMLLRHASARIYLRIPVWIRVEALQDHGGGGALLAEIPTVQLSDTWWGDHLEGELAFWLPTRGRRRLDTEMFQPHLVIGVVQLDNLSEDDLQVEKLSLRVEHLSVYEKDRWLWAEEVSVNYHGETEGSEIRMEDHPPVEARDAREITPARAQRKSFRARTFARLRAISGWGG